MDKNKKTNLNWLIAINGFGLITAIAGCLISKWEFDLIFSALCMILTNVIAIGFDIIYLMPDRVSDSLSIEKKLSSLYKALNKNNQLKKELIDSIEHLAEIHGESFKRKSLPNHVVDLFKKETIKKLSVLNDTLVNCKEGEIELEEVDCIDATKSCMLNVKRKVFAISFPDLEFWGIHGQGKSYIEANKKAIVERDVEVRRFFVVRDTDKDREVLNNSDKENEFVKILKEQLAINDLIKKGKKGKIRVFITDRRLLNLNNIQEGLEYVPDISLYDDETVSEWTERGGVLGRETHIKSSVISYRRDRLRIAQKTEHYFDQNAHSKCVEVNSSNPPEQAIEMLRNKLKTLHN